ncbi:FlgD immunoglobulin-like domain containing protein [Candidatus Eisenbacteria bacterium]|uniref:FlgD immunoglobulin-like domain containing protein n=1 Tax=Eiseniibacteriota bacterium TaxID=2212470 RepID=A0ABV6YJU5_UNCEI
MTDKQWCAVEFGFGDYDAGIFGFDIWEPCNDGAFEWSMPGWPGPNTGTEFLAHDYWSGNLLPVYWFAGYAYGEGEIPLDVYPRHDRAGFGTCDGQEVNFDAFCLGRLGIYRDGLPCNPGQPLEYACCIGSICHITAFNDCMILGGEWQLGFETCDPSPCGSSAVGDEGGRADPSALHLAPNNPNPFIRTTRISYGVPADASDAPVSLRIFDTTGSLVRTLAHASERKGQNSTAWDGTDDLGRRVGTGVYFLRLSVGLQCVTRPILLVR